MAAGEFRHPSGLTQDRIGHIYVADYENHRIQIFSELRKFLRTFGHLGHQAGEFHHPTSVAMNNQGTLYVVDKGNNRVQVFRTHITRNRGVN